MNLIIIWIKIIISNKQSYGLSSVWFACMNDLNLKWQLPTVLGKREVEGSAREYRNNFTLFCIIIQWNKSTFPYYYYIWTHKLKLYLFTSHYTDNLLLFPIITAIKNNCIYVSVCTTTMYNIDCRQQNNNNQYPIHIIKVQIILW